MRPRKQRVAPRRARRARGTRSRRLAWLALPLVAAILSLPRCLARQPLGSGLGGAEALRTIELDFGLGPESEAEQRFTGDFRARLGGALEHGAALDVDAIVNAFDGTLRAWLGSEGLPELLGGGSIDWYESAFDFGDGERLHVDFSLDDEQGFTAELLETTSSRGRALRAWVYSSAREEPVFSTKEIPVASFSGVELRVGDMFSHFRDLTSARLWFTGTDGRLLTVYRCFPASDPAWTAFSFQTPQDFAAQQTAREKLTGQLDVDDRWFFADPDDDLLLLYQQIGIVRASKTPGERLDRLLEVLRKAGEEEFLAGISSARFPDGTRLAIDTQTFRQRMVRAELGPDPVRVLYLRPGTLDIAFDSGAIGRSWLERAAADESFNFGTWIPDLWRGENEALFISVFRIRKAQSLAAGSRETERVVFDRTVRDLTAIGVYFERDEVRIGSVPYQIEITEADIGSFLGDLARTGPQAPSVPSRPGAPTAPGAVSWQLERYQEAGLTFYRDHQFVYYEVEARDVAPGQGLDGIRRLLRGRLPGRFDYPFAFSGFRDQHLTPGLLLVVPEPPEARALSSDRLRALAESACRAEGYDSPDLVWALVWNESRAGRDNFFRFEENRLDAVGRLRAKLSGRDREHFESVYGRFGALLAGSYGPGHILYENAWAMGFRGSPGELARPEVNLRYVARFLKLNGIDRTTPINTVSRIYNGPGYARNDYHVRLRQNLARAARAFAAAPPGS